MTPGGREYIRGVRTKNIERRARFLEKLGEEDAENYLHLVRRGFDILNS